MSEKFDEIRIWVDDVREAPDGYWWCTSVNEAREYIQMVEWDNAMCNYDYEVGPGKIVVIDMDHDAGDYAYDGGDFIKLLDWLEQTGRNYPIRIHSMNPVGVANMRRIIERNGWKEVGR